MTPTPPRQTDPGDPGFEGRLEAYLDDALPPAEAREFLAWLEAHPEALREVEEHRRVWALLGAYRDEEVPEGFADRVMERVGAAPRAAGGGPAPAVRLLRGVRRWRALAAAAGVLAVLGAGWALTRGGEPAPDPSAATVAAIEAVPESLLEGDAIARLATLSDEEFEALLSADPKDLLPDPRGG